MRPNLISVLNYIGANHLLGIESCRSLWDDDFDEVDMTSLLKEATYELKKDGSKIMFNDAKKIANSEKLTRMLEEGFVKDCTKYENDVLYVACGPGLYNMLKKFQTEGRIRGEVVGISHPSGANTGRIQCYLGKVEAKDSSYVWCQERAKEAKAMCLSLTPPR